MVATTLIVVQVRDAEVCLRSLVENTRPLSFYLELGLTNHRPPEVIKKLADAITDYTAAKSASRIRTNFRFSNTSGLIPS